MLNFMVACVDVLMLIARSLLWMGLQRSDSDRHSAPSSITTSTHDRARDDDGNHRLLQS